jgi:CheY-like chemotaxis protein
MPRLLAIDDHAPSADLLARTARRRGYEAKGIVETSSLAQIVANWRPDVITLDLDMPGVDGFAVMTLLSIMAFTGKLVIVSGKGMEVRYAAVRHAQDCGMVVAAEMAKPVDLKAFRDLLDLLHSHPAHCATQLTSAGS